MGVYDKKRKAVTVDTRWRRCWHEIRPLRWWVEVGRRVRAKRVAHADLKRVKQVCREVEEKWRKETK